MDSRVFHAHRTAPIVVGLDVGSTTVKAVVVDPQSRRILWHDYRRHQTRQAETVLTFLAQIEAGFPRVPPAAIRIFITGSGARPLEAPTGARFVQEVNAVTMAVETLHPDAGSVVELGGQDAKIIIFREHPTTGEKTSICSMNDKCASGTGATLDKCFIKVGMPPSETAKLDFKDDKLHHVAAKCGVFAETDIVNLIKTGIPAPEVLCSLADAIVMQNLSVLTRGNTLRPKVVLLGGPNTYLPFLQQCWRKRIPQVWAERGLTFTDDATAEELIIVPEHAELYAAFGAVVFGLHEPAEVGRYAGSNELQSYIAAGRQARLAESAGPPLLTSDRDHQTFAEAYRIPRFSPVRFDEGRVVRGVIGLDGGSTSSKAVLLDEDGTLLRKAYTLSKGNPIQDMKELLNELERQVEADGALLEVVGFGATGYAADVLEECLKADVNIVETVAHMMSATRFFGDVDVVCDIGGQDIKVLFLERGEIKSFKLSNQCSAGNGMLLQAMADQFGLPVTSYAETAFAAKLSPKFSYGCAVFLDTDRVNFQKEGFSKEELLAGLAQVLPKNVWQYVVGVPRLAALGRRFVLQGGTQYNLAAVKAQVDYIKSRVPDAEVFVHPHPGEAGAVGAAMEALRVVKRRGHSTFVGLQSAIGLTYTTRNDETTVCHFCPNACSRTFIDAERPDGTSSRYISGFSCEKGMVESKEAMLSVVRRRKDATRRYPNLVTVEAKRAFARQQNLPELPGADAVKEESVPRRTFWGVLKYQRSTRPFIRSGPSAAEGRRRWRIGMPRVLNMYSTGPFWMAYFQTLGVDARNIVWSDESSEDMFAAGGKYGSVDPCYPSKVAQAHFHQLLFEKHAERPLDAVFFPILTHVPSFVSHAVDYATCPIVAGTPDVMKAAFTKERDYFAERGIRYFAPAVSFVERIRLKQVLFETFHEALGVSADESDFAAEAGFEALRAHDRYLEDRGRQVLEEVEGEHRVAILVIGRPYHLDPGLHHGIPDEFQALGYPILSIRSIPKDPAWLAKYFGEDLAEKRVDSALSINDVWPENYSANSAQKVWAAKFAARHPNVVLLDLSSFKCGHDSPTYGIIDGIVKASHVPHAALHDLDANKPGGSIKIRVKTYAHALSLHRERLEDVAKRRAELSRRVDAKRLELLERKRATLHQRRRASAAVEREIHALKAKISAYRTGPDLPDEPASGARLVQLGKKRADGRVERIG